MKITLLLAALGWPALALAQSPYFSPHGYLGAGASVLNASLVQSSNFRFVFPTAVGPVLTAGYQLTPRLAAQLSPAVQWSGRTQSYAGYETIGGSAPIVTVTTRSRYTQLTVPLLLRVTLTSPVARLRLDGLVGATWLRTTGHSTYTETDSNSGAVVFSQDRDSEADSQALLTLGPAVRYGLGPRLELVAAVPVHYTLRSQDNYFVSAGFNDHLLLQPQLSAYYTLGGH